MKKSPKVISLDPIFKALFDQVCDCLADADDIQIMDLTIPLSPVKYIKGIDIPNDLAKDDAFSFPRPFVLDHLMRFVPADEVITDDDAEYLQLVDFAFWHTRTVALKFKYADLP